MALTIQSGPTAPPKKTTPPPKKTPAIDPNKIQNEREEGLNGLFQVASAVSIMFGQWADAGAYSLHGPNVSRETATLATRYERVGNALDALSQVGPFTAILGAAMPMILQIAANHKRLPADKLANLGVVSPEVLEGQMRLETARQEMEMRKQMQAQEDAMKDALAEMQKDKVPA